MESLQVGCLTTTAPGANSNTYPIFNSITSFGVGAWRSLGGGASRVTFSLKNSAAGTLKAYMSTDGGTNYDQVGGDITVPAASSTDISGPYDFLVDTYRDFKIDWVNGGSAQTTWRPVITLIVGDRASGT